jgi:alpha,alpha-trehalose phosphorylase
VIDQPSFSVEPWCLRETSLHLDLLAQSESVFALSNGHIGWRANLDEGAPEGLPGSYLNGVHELRPLPYAEAGYGYPESGQSLINVTNGKLIRLLVDDEPFDVRYGTVHSHERELDFRAGTLKRTVEWSSPADAKVKVTSTRIVSLVQRAVAAIEYEVEAVDSAVRLVIQSELVTNEPLPNVSADPRVAAALEAPLRAETHFANGLQVDLVHRTENSDLLIGAAMSHVVDGPDSVRSTSESFDDLGRVTFTLRLQPGEKIRMLKIVAYGWSAERTHQELRDQIDAALTAACQTGWDGLLAQQRKYLDDFWARSDVEVDGDAELQQAVRFALFHILQAGARAERRAIPAKGLTGTGYDGHAFWDTEMFVLPVLTYTLPSATAHALRWRHTTLPLARERATQLGLKGAAFPWRTITGAECSSYWPAGTAAFHVNADIADAVTRYLAATDDVDFEREVGVELLAETARLWRSLGHHDARGRFRIDGVTGPDEYSAIADNNVYTNLMAQHNLRAAADACERYLDVARTLGVDAEEMANWRDAADAMVIPFDVALGVHAQSEEFTEHQVWDFDHTTPEQYPLLLNFPYFDLYRKQVVKQADLVLAMHIRGEAFTPEQMAANFAYYERLTVRDSSLSAATQSVIAAEVGYLELAHAYLGEAARLDLEDLDHNTKDGLHIASLAGSWIALVSGLAGMRSRGGGLCFSPKLPEGISRLAFGVVFRGRNLHVEAKPGTTNFRLDSGNALDVYYFDDLTTISPGESIDIPTPAGRGLARRDPVPTQPAGRAPIFPKHRTDRGSPGGTS